MDILFISDYSIKQSPGGAQRSNQIVIDEGRNRGHNIVEFNINSNPDLLNDKSIYDIIISSNLEAIYQNFIGIIPYIATHKYHVRLEHDANRYLNSADRKELFQSCKKTFFLSEYHHQQFLRDYGDFFVNIEIVPDPINTDLFYDKKHDRTSEVLYAGYMHDLKGTQAFFDYAARNRHTDFVLAGWGEYKFTRQLIDASNIRYIGVIQHEDMPDLYNRYKSFFYRPIGYEPFCRSVAEAKLCGMIINNNDKIGCLHYLNTVGCDRFRNQCKNAHRTFWDKVEQCIQ